MLLLLIETVSFVCIDRIKYATSKDNLDKLIIKFAKLALVIKTKESITSPKLGTCSLIFLFCLLVSRSSAIDWANLFAEILFDNINFDVSSGSQLTHGLQSGTKSHLKKT